MSEQDLRRFARLRVEERIAEIRCQLAVGVAVGGKTGGAPGVWDLEEELLDELAELERALLAGEVESYVPWLLSIGRGDDS